MNGLLNDPLSGSGLLANFQQQGQQQRMRRQLGWADGGGFAQPMPQQAPQQGVPGGLLSALSQGGAQRPAGIGGQAGGLGGEGGGQSTSSTMTGMNAAEHGWDGLGLSGLVTGLLTGGATLLGGPLAGAGTYAALGAMNSRDNAGALAAFGKGAAKAAGFPLGLLGMFGGGGRGGSTINAQDYANMMDRNDAQGLAGYGGGFGSTDAGMAAALGLDGGFGGGYGDGASGIW